MLRSRVVIPLLVLVLLTPVALLGGALGALQSPAVQQWLAARISSLTPLRLTGFAIGWPLNVEADEVAVVDDEGPWLVLSQFRFAWSPTALWRDYLHIRHLSARHLDLRRLPRSQGAGGGPPQLPRLPITVGLDDLTVDEVTTGPDVGLPPVTGRLAARGGLAAGRLSMAVMLAGSAAGAAGQARLTVDGGDQALQVAGQGAVHDLPPGLPIRTVHFAGVGRLALASGDIGIGHLRLDSDKGRVTALGWLRGWGRDCRLHFSAWLPDLAVVDPSLAGSAALTGDVAGPVDQPRAVVAARPAGLATGIAEVDTVMGPAPRVTAALAMGRGFTPGLFMATIDGEKGRLRMGGFLRQPLLVGGRLHVDRMDDLASGVYAGWAEAEGMLTGAADDPLLAAVGDAAGSTEDRPVTAHALAAVRRLDGDPLGRAQLDLSSAGLDARVAAAFQWGPVARLDDLAVSSAGDRLDGNLTWDRGRGLLGGKLQGRLTALRHWTSLAGLPAVDGTARLEAELSPGRGQEGRVSIEAARLKAGDLAVRQATVRARLADLFGRPSGQGSVELGGAEAGRLQFDRLHADVRGTLQKIEMSLAGTGRPAAELSAAGTVEPEAGRYAISALQLALGKERLRLLAPTVIVQRPGLLRLGPTRLAVAGGQVDAGGTLDRDRLAGEVTVANLPLSAATPLLPDWRPTGSLSGRLTVGGTLRSPTASAVLTGRRLDFGGHHAAIDGDARADWDGKRLRASLNATGLRGSHLHAEGEGPLVLAEGHLQFPDAAIAAHVEGQGDLARLAELAPLGDQTLAGRLAVNADVSGRLGQPAVDATIRLAGGRYQNFDTGTSLSAITLTATALDARRIEVRAAGSDGGKGRFTATGQADLAGGPSFNADIALDHLRVVNLDLASGDANGELHLDGAGEQGSVSGHVTIDGAEVDIGQTLPTQVVTLDVVNVNLPRNEAPPEEPPAGPSFHLALAVGAELRDVRVHGRGLDSQWNGHLDLGGTASQPTVLGQMTSIRGSFDLAGHRLSLSQGRIIFDGQHPPDPRLDLTAQAQAQDVTAQVHVTGTADKPDLAFTSDPPLPRDEVLARLLFGSSVSQLSVLQQLALAKAAAGQIGGSDVSSFDPLGKARSVLGLDMLEAGSDTTNPLSISGLSSVPAAPGSGPNPALTAAQQSTGTRSLGPSLSAGKYLNDRTFLRVEQGTTGGQVTMDIELGAGFAAQTQIGENSGGGLGFRWKKDY